jgi:hypothetical protein
MYNTKGGGHADASDSPKPTASLDDPLSQPFIATLHNCSTWVLHNRFCEKFLYGLQILEKYMQKAEQDWSRDLGNLTTTVKLGQSN